MSDNEHEENRLLRQRLQESLRLLSKYADAVAPLTEGDSLSTANERVICDVHAEAAIMLKECNYG